MHTVLLINPRAGDGLSTKTARSVASQFRAVSEVRVAIAEDVSAIARLAAEAVTEGTDVLAVLGGHSAVHRAMQVCVGTSTAFAVVPSGTGNDLAQALAIPPDPVAAARAAAEAMIRGQGRRIDLGRVVGGDWFATVLCAGVDSMVNARVNRMRWPRGKSRYDLAVLEQLVGLRSMPLRVETDADTFELPATLVAIGNTAWYGGGIPICPDANPRDGQLDVTVVGAVSRRDLLRVLPRLRVGRHVDHPAVRSLRVRSVRLGGENGWCAFADGDPQARLPLTVRADPAALRVVAPAEHASTRS